MFTKAPKSQSLTEVDLGRQGRSEVATAGCDQHGLNKCRFGTQQRRFLISPHLSVSPLDLFSRRIFVESRIAGASPSAHLGEQLPTARLTAAAHCFSQQKHKSYTMPSDRSKSQCEQTMRLGALIHRKSKASRASRLSNNPSGAAPHQSSVGLVLFSSLKPSGQTHISGTSEPAPGLPTYRHHPATVQHNAQQQPLIDCQNLPGESQL